MNPVKKNKLINMLSEKMNLPVDVVGPIVSVYWKYINDILSETNHTHIKVDRLGVFFIKPWAVDVQKKRTLAYLSVIGKAKTMQQYAIVKQKTAKLDNYNKLLEKIQQNEQKKSNIKKIRSIYEHNKTLEGKG